MVARAVSSGMFIGIEPTGRAPGQVLATPVGG